jgi:hypothetical protein
MPLWVGILVYVVMIGTLIWGIAWDRRMAKSGFYRQRSQRGVKEEL